MENLQCSVNRASHHFDNGEIKDAYHMFLLNAQNIIKPLFDVKFIHNSIVSKPQNFDSLLCMLHTCVDKVEKIMEYHSTSSRKAPPPPLPPKPTSKPVLPPKPSRPLPNTPDYNSVEFFHVPDGEIDPNNLVPAQTNNNDSLTPSAHVKNIPHIPTPPLIVSHKTLQSKLEELESLINEYRVQKRLVQQQVKDTSQMTEEELNNAILKYTPYVAEAKQTLNRIRTVHMTAATIPSILHFQPGVIAYHITRIEAAIFSAIPTKALLSHSPKNPHARIVASTDFFNFITRIIEHSILLPQEASSRSQHIHHWIKIATKCQDLNNYQTLKAIVSALGTPPVQRLKRTWSYIPKRSQSKLDVLNELMSESNNYEKYREHMGITSKTVQKSQSEHAKRPTIPFLGTFIHDMTYLLAAVQHQEQQQSTPRSRQARPLSSIDTFQNDSRVQKLLNTFELFQACPPYKKNPTSQYAKTVQRPGSPVRPAFSQALQRSKSSFGRLGGAMGFGTSYMENSNDTHQTGENESDLDLEEQSNLVIQYILMRPWVSQDTVDELSVLREPPRANSKPGNSRSNSVGSHYTGSLISNTSSFMRLSTSCNSTATNGSSSTLESRPDSFEDSGRLVKDIESAAHLSSPLAESNFRNGPGPLLIPQTIHDEKWDHMMPMYDIDVAPLVPPRPKALSHKLENDI